MLPHLNPTSQSQVSFTQEPLPTIRFAEDCTEDFIDRYVSVYGDPRGGALIDPDFIYALKNQGCGGADMFYVYWYLRKGRWIQKVIARFMLSADAVLQHGRPLAVSGEPWIFVPGHLFIPWPWPRSDKAPKKRKKQGRRPAVTKIVPDYSDVGHRRPAGEVTR